MTPHGTWDSPEVGGCGCIPAKEETVAASMSTWTPLHNCHSPKTPRLLPARVRPLASPFPTGITLALLLCSLMQLVVASVQLAASSSYNASPDDSEAFTLHASLRNAGGSGHIPTAGVTAPPAVQDLPPRYLEKDTLHAPARATRSITAIRRVEMHGPPVTNRKTLFVELMVLTDNSFYRHYGSEVNARQRVSQVLSVANKVLGGVGVVLVPVDVQRWKTETNTNIDELQQYRWNLLQKKSNHPNDHTVLFTRKQRPRGRRCDTPLRGMCRKRQSVSIVEDEGKGPSVAGVALAHQVGHSLGMEEDAEDPDRDCRCAASICVMSRHFRNVSTPNLAWSVCSKQSFDSTLETLALDCLKNVPTRMYPSSRCGDGVVDNGEQCDCGPEEFCNNPCCVATTCTLALNASCASGSCCDIQKCKPKPPGAVCRASITECDLPEFCSGHSEYCPADVTKADGEPCREGHCFSGECGSREGQCKRLWGPSASTASSDCYSKLNVKGNPAGNCGLRQAGFRRCREKEALCGTLHCLASVPSSHLLQEHRNGSRRAGPDMCHFILGSKNYEYPAHHWLTPDGAPCGHGKMCVKQRCEDIPRLTGACRDGCSGNGVCNSRGHCHCDAGFSPPDCLLVGLGGSVDSNAMSDTSDYRVLITLAWVVVVLLLSLMAVTCCLWGCCKGWYKRKGRDNISGALPCCATCLDACCCPVMTKTVRWLLTVGASPKKKEANRDVEVDNEENEHMVCSVDVDVKGSSQTNSWGVANEKLVTDVVTITPKNSPDFRRKVRLPSDSPLLHHRSESNLHRPKYQQSISKDSGCVSDTDEDASSRSASPQMSMSSLLSIVMKFGDKKPKTMPDSESHRLKGSGSQKAIPLCRFVVDPLAGRRNSRRATPPPQHVRPSYSRSFSTDVSTVGKRRAGTPPPPPSTLKPNRSEENLSKACEMPSHDRFPHTHPSPPPDAPPLVSMPLKRQNKKDGARVAVTTSSSKVPLKPPKNKPLPSPPKVPPLKPTLSAQAESQ